MLNAKTLAVALASSLLSLPLLAGCAADAPEEGQEEQANVDVDSNEAKTDATGYSCQCPTDQVLDNDGLCYAACPSGYDGVGPVCWQRCASGFYSTGAFCQRDTSIVSANTSACHWYDKCGLTFDKGCSTCPSGYSNDGCTCRRDAYIYAKPTTTRGAGTTPTCATR